MTLALFTELSSLVLLRVRESLNSRLHFLIFREVWNIFHTFLAEANANIVMVQHDRLSADLDPNEAIIHIACEVGGREHGERVIKVLEKNGYNIVME